MRSGRDGVRLWICRATRRRKPRMGRIEGKIDDGQSHLKALLGQRPAKDCPDVQDRDDLVLGSWCGRISRVWSDEGKHGTAPSQRRMTMTMSRKKSSRSDVEGQPKRRTSKGRKEKGGEEQVEEVVNVEGEIEVGSNWGE
jgi:hypothetical protein